MRDKIVKEILDHLPEKLPILLVGPEGSGKSYALAALKKELLEEGIPEKEILLIDLDKMTDGIPAGKNNRFFEIKELLKTQEPPSYVLVDNIHIIPDPFKFIKGFQKRYPETKFIMTSSIDYRVFNPHIQREWIILPINYPSFTDFLTLKGKGDLRKVIAPYSIQELTKGFLFEDREFLAMFEERIKAMFTEYITYGGIPRIVQTDPFKKVNGLHYIYNKVLYMGTHLSSLASPIRDVEYLRNVLTYLAYNIGDPFNLSRAAVELNISRPTVDKCLKFLEAFQFIKKIQPHHTNKPKELVRRPKYYIVDCGLYNYIVGNFNPVENRLDGRKLAENHLFITLNSTISLNQIRYWQIKSGVKVDFVIYTRPVIPLILLLQDIPFPKVPTGLRHFIREYNPGGAIVITRGYLGKAIYKKTLILYIPIWFIG